MIRRNWLVSLSLMLGLSVLLGTRLFGQSEPLPTSPPPLETSAEELRRVSDAERRFTSNQPRHWRQLLLRRQ
jgi:hypothetical protein